MKKIDAHFHINLGNFDLKAILQYMDSKKVDQMWLLSWEEINAPIPQLYKHLSIEDLF